MVEMERVRERLIADRDDQSDRPRWVSPPHQPAYPPIRQRYYSIPVGTWKGEAAIILGGGPSMNAEVVARLQGKVRMIAVNDAYLLAPHADVLFAADQRWWNWNEGKVHQYKGPLKLSRQNVIRRGVERMRWDRTIALSRRPDHVAGFCGGSHALNIAYLYGANPIFLFGFDMRPGNWHDNHQLPPLEGQHKNKFIPALERMAPELSKENIIVYNASPGSELKCFPIIDPEQVSEML